VWAWGANSSGQIGDGKTGDNVIKPVKVLTGASLISTTADNVAAVAS
jgi:alpha-tubulin suppressor-like RCC1 family protein